MKLSTLLKMFESFDEIEDQLSDPYGRRATGASDYQTKLAEIAIELTSSESFARSWTHMREAICELQNEDVVVGNLGKKGRS